MISPPEFDEEPFETDPEEIRERKQAQRERIAALSARSTNSGRNGEPASVGDDASAVEKKATSKRAGLSLKARALNFLSRREYSRLELGRRLAPHADSAEEVEALLDALVEQKWLSDERFAHSVVNRRASRVGTRVILQELRQHGVDVHQTEIIKEELMATELERAKQVWGKKFSAPPDDPRSYAKQYRFTAIRGFSGCTLPQILGDWEDDLA